VTRCQGGETLEDIRHEIVLKELLGRAQEHGRNGYAVSCLHEISDLGTVSPWRRAG
jgi:hypothetical protein